MEFNFLPQKAEQAILYISEAIPDKGNLYKVLKAIYFADKKHLFEFGRFIFGDSYVAMQHGPVPSNSYDLVKKAKGISGKDKNNALFQVDSENTIIPLVKADLSVFSKSDLLCMDLIIDQIRGLSFHQVRSLSHDQAYNQADENDFMSIESIIEMAPNKDKLVNYLLSRHV